MNTFKRTFGIALLIVIIFTTVTLFLPSKISIVKSTNISGNTDCVTNIIDDFHQWENWLPSLKENISTITVLSENKAVLRQSSGKEINLAFEIKTPDSTLISMNQTGTNPVEMIFLLSHANNGNRLHLIVNTRLKWYPWERIGGIFLDKMMGSQYQRVLENIKGACSGLASVEMP